MLEVEHLELEGGYALLVLIEGWWWIEVYSHWDNIVPILSIDGDTRESAIESLDEVGPDEYFSPRNQVSNYAGALEDNCKRRGIEVPAKLPPLPFMPVRGLG